MPYLYAFTNKASPAAGDYLHLASTADSGADRKVLVSALFTSPSLTTPTLGAASATSVAASGAMTAATFNKLTLTTPATAATLTLANGSSLITTGAYALTLALGANVTLTVPTTSATLARTDAAQTFTGPQTFSGAISGAAITGTTLGMTGAVTAMNATAIPAGGTSGSGFLFSSTANFGVFFGSGAPSISAAKGSLYLRSDGSSTSTRAYVNTDGSTTWTAITTAA